MSVDLIRDFLSQRLVNSATTNNTSSSHSDSEEHHSDAGSSSSSSSSSIHAPAMNPQTASIFNNFASNANPFTMQNRPQSNNNNTNSFAAAIAAGQMLQMQMQLAQLAQMQLINPMMMNPLLFNPNTINGNTNNINTITNPDLNHKSSLFPTLDQLKSALQSPKHSPKNTILTPNSVPPKLTASPSPRKRCNQSKSEQKPVNLSQQHGENGGHGVTEGSPSKRPKAVKKLTFAEEETSSPVSGMFIKDASAVPPPSELQAEVDQLDETAQYVEVTEETRAAIAKIPNVIGESVCFLCKVKYEDVFRLAQHKCPRIVHEEYRCPDCDKVFSCPANLASHRRWHKPKDGQTGERHTELSNFCDMCGERFASKKQLKLHSCSNNSIKDLQTSPVVTTKLWTGQAVIKHLTMAS